MIAVVLLTLEPLGLHVVLVCQMDQLALIVIVAAALQATGGLAFGHLRCEALDDLFKIMPALLRCKVRHRLAGHFLTVLQILRCDYTLHDERLFIADRGTL